MVFTISNEELEKKPLAKDMAVCPNCKKKHKIIWATDEGGNQSKSLGGVQCGDSDYLVAIDEKLI